MTATPASKWLKSTEWLADQIGKPGVAVVDASFYLPTQKRDAKAEYVASHIPGAVFFNIETIADDSTDLPHMLPGPAQFGDAVGVPARKIGEAHRHPARAGTQQRAFGARGRCGRGRHRRLFFGRQQGRAGARGQEP